MMVVIPTSTDVKLTYGRSLTDYGAYLLTFFGIIAAFFLWRRGDVRHANTSAHLTGIDPEPGSERGVDVHPAAPSAGRAVAGTSTAPRQRVACRGLRAAVIARRAPRRRATRRPEHLDLGPAAARGRFSGAQRRPGSHRPGCSDVAGWGFGADRGTDGGTRREHRSDPARCSEDDVSAGLRIPEGIDMSTSAVDPASVDLEWMDRYTTGEVPTQPSDDDHDDQEA